MSFEGACHSDTRNVLHKKNIWTQSDIIPMGEEKIWLALWKLKYAFQFRSRLSLTNDPSLTFLTSQHGVFQFRRQQTYCMWYCFADSPGSSVIKLWQQQQQQTKEMPWWHECAVLTKHVCLFHSSYRWDSAINESTFHLIVLHNALLGFITSCDVITKLMHFCLLFVWCADT